MKSKYKYKKMNNEPLPEFGWGSTIGTIAGVALSPFTGGASIPIGTALGSSADMLLDKPNDVNSIVNVPQYNVNPFNTTNFYNPVKAFGGPVDPNAEVEGNEVIQHNPGQVPIPTGQGGVQQIASDMSVAQGPTHADGGVPVAAQPGSMVVSDRMPAPNTKEYKSIANEVERLGRKKGMLEKKLSKNPGDTFAKNSIELIQGQIDKLVTQQEEMKQANAEAIMGRAIKKAYGGEIEYGHGGKIYIKPSHRGRFTEYKKRTGKTTEEALHSKDPHVRKMAQFAKNARKWHHADGGMIEGTPLDENFSRMWNWGGMYPYGGGIGDYLNNIIPNYITNGYAPNVIDLGGGRSTPETALPNFYTSNKEKKTFKLPNVDGSNLMYAAQFLPDIVGMFQKKDAPLNPANYMNTRFMTPTTYDTSAEEGAITDARSRSLKLAKDMSGGDASLYTQLGNAAINTGYANLGQVYNKAQNINMQNKMQADQVNAGIEGQNMNMKLQIANANAADAQAVESNKLSSLQGISNKLASLYSQNKQFKLLESMFPHYKYNGDGTITFNGKVYSGQDALDITNNLMRYNASMGMNYAGIKH